MSLLRAGRRIVAALIRCSHSNAYASRSRHSVTVPVPLKTPYLFEPVSSKRIRRELLVFLVRCIMVPHFIVLIKPVA